MFVDGPDVLTWFDLHITVAPRINQRRVPELRDAWRLRHFTACFGLADRSGYRWHIEDTGSHIRVTFDPRAVTGG